MVPKAQETKENLDKVDFIKIKIFCASRKLEKTTYRMGENIY